MLKIWWKIKHNASKFLDAPEDLKKSLKIRKSVSLISDISTIDYKRSAKFANSRLQMARLTLQSISTRNDDGDTSPHVSTPSPFTHAHHLFLTICVRQVVILVAERSSGYLVAVYWKCRESLRHLRKRRSCCCRTSPGTCRRNPRHCSTAMLSSFRRYPFVSTETCEVHKKILISSFFSVNYAIRFLLYKI